MLRTRTYAPEAALYTGALERNQATYFELRIPKNKHTFEQNIHTAKEESERSRRSRKRNVLTGFPGISAVVMMMSESAETLANRAAAA